MTSHSTGEGKSPRFVAEISLGNTLLILTIICGFVAHYTELGLTGNQTQKDVATLRADMTTQIGQVKESLTTLKATVKEGQSAVALQIQKLPVDQAELDRHENDIASMKTDISTVREDFITMKGAVANLSDNLSNALHASNVPLMPTGRR